MGTYDKQITMAQRLIAKKGEIVTWNSFTDGVPSDPNEPWNASAGSSVSHSVSIVFLPAERKGEETLKYFDGSVVPTGMEVGYMAAVDFDPKLKDFITRGSVQYNVTLMDKYAPNGQVILYVIGFSK